MLHRKWLGSIDSFKFTFSLEKRMAKIRKWLVCTSIEQDVYQSQNEKAISVLLLLLLWLVPDVDKWYRTLGSGEGCLPTSSSVCTLSHSGAHCSVQCSSG